MTTPPLTGPLCTRDSLAADLRALGVRPGRVLLVQRGTPVFPADDAYLTLHNAQVLLGQRTVAGDMTGPVATRMVLSDPSVDVAVLEVARGGLRCSSQPTASARVCARSPGSRP